jgi:hypothetical protein
MGFVVGCLVDHEATFKIEGVTHWSIPVNNLNDSEDFHCMSATITSFRASGTNRKIKPSMGIFFS